MPKNNLTQAMCYQANLINPKHILHHCFNWGKKLVLFLQFKRFTIATHHVNRGRTTSVSISYDVFLIYSILHIITTAYLKITWRTQIRRAIMTSVIILSLFSRHFNNVTNYKLENNSLNTLIIKNILASSQTPSMNSE